MKKWRGDIAFLIIVGTLVGGWLYLYPQSAEGPLSRLPTPDDLARGRVSSYASFEGLKLAYRLYEPSTDVEHVLVFLHDTLLHGGWYADLAQDLVAEGVAVYLPDRRGRGLSAGDPRQVAADRSVLVEDITAMIEVAQSRHPQADIFVGGHGRGAGLALGYAVSGRPLSGLVLVAPLISDGQPNLRLEGQRSLLTAHPVEAFLARSGLYHWHVWHVNWPRSMVGADPAIGTELSISDMRETVPEDPAAAYAALSVPLLCIQGKEDPLLDAGRTPDLVALFGSANRQLEVLPNVGYLTVVEAAANPIAHWLEGR
jgi:alpha-beta hydrolase superfamily lysophospholipase